MTGPDLKIREAGAGDASRVAGIHVRSWLQAYRSFAPAAYLDSLDQDAQRLNYWQPRLEEPRAGSTTWIAFLGGIPAGFANNEPPKEEPAPWEQVPRGCGWLFHIHLAPEFRGRGIGRALFEYSMAAFAAAGVREAVLWVYEANEASRGFYEHMGWKPDGARVERPLAWVGRDGTPGEARLAMVRYRGKTGT